MKATGKVCVGLTLLTEPEREEAAVWRRYSARGDARLRESLFERYRKLAAGLAKRFSRRHQVSHDRSRDLEQFAYQGLLEAIDRFDPSLGVPFPGFASRRITGSIIDGLAQLDEAGARMRFQRLIERERLESLAGARSSRRSALDDLADLVADLALGLMLEAEERREQARNSGQGENGFESLAWREMQTTLGLRVAELPEPERSVIRHHYQNDMLFAQIAAMLGLSRGRISQLHRSALEKLRKTMRQFP